MQNKRGLTEMDEQVKKVESHFLVARMLQLPILQSNGKLDKALSLIAIVAEYLLVIHIGAVIGWLIGLWVGNIYFDHIPIEDYSKAFILTKRGVIPFAFTKSGAIIGILISITVLAAINRRLFIKEVTGLYKQGITSSKTIAQRLGHSVWRVERAIKKFNKMDITQSKNKSEIAIATASSEASFQQCTVVKTDYSTIACVI
jgi:hypothetical protein